VGVRLASGGTVSNSGTITSTGTGTTPPSFTDAVAFFAGGRLINNSTSIPALYLAERESGSMPLAAGSVPPLQLAEQSRLRLGLRCGE